MTHFSCASACAFVCSAHFFLLFDDRCLLSFCCSQVSRLFFLFIAHRLPSCFHVFLLLLTGCFPVLCSKVAFFFSLPCFPSLAHRLFPVLCSKVAYLFSSLFTGCFLFFAQRFALFFLVSCFCFFFVFSCYSCL